MAKYTQLSMYNYAVYIYTNLRYNFVHFVKSYPHRTQHIEIINLDLWVGEQKDNFDLKSYFLHIYFNCYHNL